MFLPLVLVVCAFLQGDNGQLNGTVVDPNGAAIVGAGVKLTSQSTSQVRELVTGDSGDFAFTLLPPGNYKLEVSASGFRTVLIDDAHVNITQTTSLAVRLDVTALSGGELTITADPPLVQAESSQSGRVIEGQTIRQLPLPTRNFQQLLNWTNFANPNSNIAVPATFGRITATSSGPHVIQFAAKVSF